MAKKPRIERGMTRFIIDTVGLPVRAILGPRLQSNWLFTSLRDERMMAVKPHVIGKCLDVGVGHENIFIKYFYPYGEGVDFFPYKGVDKIIDDPTCFPYPSGSFDSVTLIAVGGHMPRSIRGAEFKEFFRILKRGGRLIMTEGEVVTQYLIHMFGYCQGIITEKTLDYQRGMKDDEDFCIPHNEILRLYQEAGFERPFRLFFQLGLNRIYIGQKPLTTFCRVDMPLKVTKDQ